MTATNVQSIKRTIQLDVPPANKELRARLYQGDIFRVPATFSSRELVSKVMGLVEKHLGSDPCTVQFRTSVQNVVQAIAEVNKLLWSEDYQALLKELINEVGFDPQQNPFSGLSKGLRFRANPHLEDENADHGIPRNFHRDTWFASPQCQINWWIPLHDVGEDETFSFFPDYFYAPTQNTSAEFDLGQWKEKVGKNFGYGDKQKRDLYPRVNAPDFDGGQPLRFSAQAGDVILFSAHQLHRTNFHSAGHTRFSVDFRTVHLADRDAGIGAPNVDNASHGEDGWEAH